MSAMFTAMLADATEDDLKRLAQLLHPFIASQTSETDTQRWLNVQQASDYIACTRSRLYALKSAGRIPHHKDGSRLLFDRYELDQWVRNGGGIRP